MDDFSAFHSCSSPNISLHLTGANHPHQMPRSALRHPSQERVAVQNLTSQSDIHAASYYNNSSTLADRKRTDRRYFSPEKLARVRERDAFRKRLERLNMSAEKRRDLRSKDRARKAAVRMQKKANDEKVPMTTCGQSNELAHVSSSPEHRHAKFGQQVIDSHLPASSSHDPNNGDRRKKASDDRPDHFRKIPVKSLLN